MRAKGTVRPSEKPKVKSARKRESVGSLTHLGGLVDNSGRPSSDVASREDEGEHEVGSSVCVMAQNEPAILLAVASRSWMCLGEIDSRGVAESVRAEQGFHPARLSSGPTKLSIQQHCLSGTTLAARLRRGG